MRARLGATAPTLYSSPTLSLPRKRERETYGNHGFTLIELSIVLVVIGLLVGGVLVGQDMIRAAQVRATVSQVEKLNTAINTFKGKYGALPGDIQPALVTQFGFTVTPTRAGTVGQGDGNGLIEGFAFGNATVCDWCTGQGETAWFWEDLTTNSGLYEGGFTYAGTATTPTLTGTGTPSIGSILPPSKLGGATYLYVYAYNSVNYIGLSAVYELNFNGDPYANGGSPGLTVAQAYAIDKKVDDGEPQTGRITAKWAAWDVGGGAPTWSQGPGVNGPSGTAATPGSPTTCYDNGGVAGTQNYSMEQNNGAGVNCGLFFQFQ